MTREGRVVPQDAGATLARVAQRRHHYEQAFEACLRARRIPYVSVNEARKALLPVGAPARGARTLPAHDEPATSLKSFDFVVYGERENLLLDVKGRRIPAQRRARPADPLARGALEPRGRLESWVTLDDVDSLRRWEELFGEGFRAAFVFVYECDGQPPDALFQEVFEHRGRWYAFRAVFLREYALHMRTRSARWRTVHLAASAFERVSQPFCRSASDPFPAPDDAPAPALHALDAGISSLRP